jgi:hydrogenase maturation protease
LTAPEQTHRSVVVIGIGNGLRGDDAAGLEVARRLADLNELAGIEVRSHEGDGVALLDLWDRAEAVVLVDSARAGGPPGTIHRIDASSVPVHVPLGAISSHAAGVAEAIELARALDMLPSRCLVYGLEGGSFEAGASLTASVAGVIDAASDAVRREALALVERFCRSPVVRAVG